MKSSRAEVFLSGAPNARAVVYDPSSTPLPNAEFPMSNQFRPSSVDRYSRPAADPMMIPFGSIGLTANTWTELSHWANPRSKSPCVRLIGGLPLNWAWKKVAGTGGRRGGGYAPLL